MTSIDRFLATLIVLSLSLLFFREAEAWAQTRQIRPDIVVSVSGAVTKARVLKLPADARAIHAVERCGGLTSDANLASVELARPLKDGDHLVVESKQAEPIKSGDTPLALDVPEPPEREGVASTPDRPRGYQEVERKPTPRARRGRSRKPRPEEPDRTLNINRASAEELDSLPGVGPVLAQRIVDARQMAPGGTFSSLEELETIRGIKGKTLLRLRPHLKLEGS